MSFTSYNRDNGTITFNVTKCSDYWYKKEYVDNALKQIETTSGIKSTMTDKEKVRQINRFLCTKFNLVFGGTNMYRMMKDKDGSCVEHSKVVFYLCKKNNIPVQTISLTSKDKYQQGHMINRVKINGVWYYCDTMWNHGTFGTGKVGEHYLFMKSLGNDYTKMYSNASNPTVNDYFPGN